jgi:hypothetical protein
MWASKRKQVYEATPAAPVLIGSSRIKFDIDMETWEKAAGRKPVQLALEGTTPRPLLEDLANDQNFKGNLVVDVTEMLFFTPSGNYYEERANKNIKSYPKWSLAQQASFRINRFLESNFVFLDEEEKSVGVLMKRLPVPRRPGVFPGLNFPPEWAYGTFDRQTVMDQRFLKSSAMQKQVQGVWASVGGLSGKRGVGGDTLTAILKSVKTAVDKIKARGGQVLFVRTPSSGPFWEAEKKSFPRELYWDRLLAYTQTPGIHFEDYPALSKYTCPEWSHLSPTDAITFTQDFIRIMQEKTGWQVAANKAVPPFQIAASKSVSTAK